jgi:VRR-NUC domain
VSRIDGILEVAGSETLAVRRRRESRREEWNEHNKLAWLLERYLDPSRTFWTSLENKPLTMLSGIFQKRRGVRSGLPDVLIVYRHTTGTIVIFIELKSRRGVASNAQKQLSNFATLRFCIGEIAEAALTQPGAATRRDLIAALGDAEL